METEQVKLYGKVLISQPTLCGMLDLSRSGLIKLKAKDPSFPKPLKDGTSRQAAVYFVLAEVDAYIAARIAARDAGTGEAAK